MTEQEIEQVLSDAGLSEIIKPFTSAIEIDVYEKHPNGGWWCPYKAIDALINLGRKLEREKALSATQ